MKGDVVASIVKGFPALNKAGNVNCYGKTSHRVLSAAYTVEPTIGIEPMNLFLTKEALYRLSYVGKQ